MALRPVLRWHGGKWRLAPWIIAHLPPHRVYVEPYGGAASVLLRKPRAYAEVYNDLDGEVVNLFRVLRDNMDAGRLEAKLRFTPYSREEFRQAYEPATDRVERARRLIIRSFMGFGSDGHNAEVTTGFRSNSHRSGTTPAQDWANYPNTMRFVVARLQGVVIENRPALQICAQQDARDALHYLDPPYMPETRSQKSRRGRLKYHAYTHEMTLQDHALMLSTAKGLKGMVAISGYRSELYDAELKGWRRFDRATHTDGARKRIECLWLSPRAAQALRQPSLPMEDKAA